MASKIDPTLIRATIVTVILSIVVGFNSIIYANSVSHRSDRRSEQNLKNFCELIITLDDAYNKNPPQTQTGKVVARDMHSLRTRLNC